jgi:hypothetical protein
MSMTVTADASAGAFGNGINLRVEVLTNVAATQNGASATSVTAESAAITTTVTGSRVYGAALNNNTAFTVNGSTTAIDAITDATNSVRYATCKQKTDTGTPGAETIGYSSTFHDGGIALFEVLSNGGVINEEQTAPAAATSTASSIATTAGFTPPQGSLLVALVSAKSTGVSISDSTGLVWTQKAFANTDGTIAVYIARVPAPASGDPYVAAQGGMNGTSSVVLPVLHNVAVGDELIVEMSMSSGSASSVSDSQGNTYASNQTQTTSQNSYNYVCKATTALTAGIDTITPVRSGSTGQNNVIIVGVPNATASPVEGSTVSKTAAGTSTAPSVTSGTLNQASEVIIACQTSASTGGGPVWASGWNVLANEVILSGALRMSVAWQRVNSTTAVTASATIISAAWEVMLTAIKVSNSIGSVAMHKQGLAASGIEKESATGSVRMHKQGLAVTAATTSLVTATGSVRMHKMGLSSVGKETEAATGSVSMHKMGLSDAGTEKFIATGSVSMHKMGLSDAGTEKFIATGSVRMHKQALSLSGKETETGTGSVARHKMQIHALSAGVASGTGSVARHKMGLAAYGDPQSIRLDNSAEGGTNGTTVSTVNSGGLSGVPFDTVSIGTAAAITFDNTHPAHGLLGYKFVTGSPAANAFFGWQSAISTGPLLKIWARKYYYMTAYSGTQVRLMRATSSGTLRAAVAVDSSGHVILIDASGTGRGTSVGVVPLNAKYRLEAKFVGDASAGQVECQMFTTNPEGIIPDEVVTSAITLNTGGTINRIDWGNPASVASYTFWGDEPAVSTRGYPGPVPMAIVVRHKMGIAASGGVVGPDLRNNFSGLTNGTTLTTGNTGGVSGRAFDAIGSVASGTLVADNTHLGLDAMAFKVATAGTSGTPFVQWSKAGSLGYDRTKLYFRCDNLITTAASPAFRPFAFRTTAGTHIFSPLISGNAVSCSYGSAFNGLTGFTQTVVNNQYFRIEGYVDINASTVHIELYLSQKDAVPVATKDFTAVAFGNNIQRIDIGNANSAASDGPFWIDEVGFSETGPLSPPHISMHKMGLAGSGKETESGTGSVARHKMGIAASGHVLYGSVRMHKMGLSNVGTEKFIGTGSVSMHKMGLSSSGSEKEIATGSIRMHKMGLSGVGTELNAGLGSVRMHKMGLADVGTERFAGTASVRMHKMGLAGTEVETFFAVGGVRAPKMGVHVTAIIKLSFTGTASVRMHKMRVLGQTPPIESSSLFVFSQV